MKSGMEINVFALKVSSMLMVNADHVASTPFTMEKIVFASQDSLEIETGATNVTEHAKSVMHRERMGVLLARMTLC